MAKSQEKNLYEGVTYTDSMLDTVWRKVEDVVSNVYPDGDPIDWLGPWLEKQGISGFMIGDVLDKAAAKHGYSSIYEYYDSMSDLYENTINEISTDLLTRYKSAAAKDASKSDKRGDTARGNKRFSGIIKATLKQFDNDAKKRAENKHTEGTMGGINRSAPATDVSYEKVLDDKQLNELNLDTLKSYARKTSAPQSTDRLGKVLKHARGHEHAIQQIARKIGDKTHGQAVTRTYEEYLSEKLNNILELNEDDKEEIFKRFADVLGKQHKEKEVVKKNPTKDIPFNGWTIRYRTGQPGQKTQWMVINKKGEIKGRGESFSDKEAVGDAEEYIKTGAGSTQQATDNVTIDFNVNFAEEFAPGGETLYVRFLKDVSNPTLYISTEPADKFKRTHIRNQKDKITGETSLLPMVSMSPAEANALGLQPNGRYILGDKDVVDNNTVSFPLIYQSTVQGKGDMVKMGKPGLTVAHNRKVKEEYRGVWHGDAEKNVKAPKSSMQGKGDVRFSDMVKDTINTHGLKWAFDFYVNKHGLPPRQFQIFAGLTVGSPNKKSQLAAQNNVEQPKPQKKQSWLQRLRNKLPFEE